MRRAATVLVVALAVVVVAVAAIDVIGPAGGLTPGSASAIISRDGLTLAADTPCARPPAQCPARYTFAPGRVMTLWFSVRNAGALDLTVDGIDDWVRSLPADPLVRPIDVLDGGDVARGFEDVSTPFVRLVLHPGDQRLIGIRLRTTSDMRFACDHWAPGGAIGWSDVPVSWHWLAARRVTKIPLMREFQMSTPTASDCAR